MVRVCRRYLLRLPETARSRARPAIKIFSRKGAKGDAKAAKRIFLCVFASFFAPLREPKQTLCKPNVNLSCWASSFSVSLLRLVRRPQSRKSIHHRGGRGTRSIRFVCSFVERT